MKNSWWYYWRRKGHITKNCVEQFAFLDTSSFRNSFKCNRGSYNWRNVKIDICDDRMQISSLSGKLFLPYEICIDKTVCHYGHYRYWFICPNPNCSKRVKRLYNDQGILQCRHCLRLAYISQNTRKSDRLLAMAQKLARKLEGDEFFHLVRPKRMHHTTYQKIKSKIEEYILAANISFMNEFYLSYSKV